MTGRNTAEMVDGAKAEMALSLVRALLPAEKLSEVCLSPLGFNDLSEGTIPSVFYHFLLGYPENPSYVLQVDVTPALFERSHLNEWEASRDEPGWGKLRILLSTAESPRFFLNYPFMETRTHPGYWDFGRILGFHSPLISGLSMRTTLLNSFCWEKIGEGKSAFLAVALPGKGFQSRVITGFLPIGSFIDEEIGFSMRVRGILFSLFWLNIALAVLVAVRIETPVARLGAAAQWVMRGNFSKRLEEHRGDEFGQLAVAFNNMLDLVGQGKLLNRFVSDSARDSVRAFVSGDLEAGAPISIEAVIMFAGPAGFKERLHLASPTEVIADLNLLLETIARAVRANGGEVNKFIGEKVLAVFALTGPAGRPDAAAFATAAAEEICERVGKLLPWRNTAMGVGLVLGPAISGNLGTDRVRLERTVIGDTVNLASRLCDIALGSRGGGIILDSALEAELRFQGNLSINARTRRLPALRVKGKQRSVGAFRLDL